MTAKKVQLGLRPSTKPAAPADADKWVEHRTVDGPEPNKRLTIDVPESLHRAIKSACAMRGTKIADEVREMLIEKYTKS
jgi:hypothetical protein